MEKSTYKPLLLVDMNGTLGYRSEVPVEGGKLLLYIRRKYFYLREGVADSLKKLSQHFNVCIYTSIMKHNVLPLLSAMDRNWKNYITEVYDREYNKPDPNAKEEWDTIRDLDKIWKHSKRSKRDTILIDNESRKFQDAPENGLVVPEFGVSEVKMRKAGTMATLQEYLLTMAKDPSFGTEEFDVRQYMKENKYVPSQTTELSDLAAKIGKVRISDKLDFNVYGPTTMRFDKIQRGKVTYHGETSGNKVDAEGVLHETACVENRMQLALLLDENNYGLKVYINDKLTPYEREDCKSFLKQK